MNFRYYFALSFVKSIINYNSRMRMYCNTIKIYHLERDSAGCAGAKQNPIRRRHRRTDNVELA